MLYVVILSVAFAVLWIGLAIYSLRQPPPRLPPPLDGHLGSAESAGYVESSSELSTRTVEEESRHVRIEPTPMFDDDSAATESQSEQRPIVAQTPSPSAAPDTGPIRDTEKLSEIREPQVPVGSVQPEKRASDDIRSADSNEPEAERFPMGMHRRQQSAPAVLPSEPQSTQQWQDAVSIIAKQLPEATKTATPLPAPGSSELQVPDNELAAASQENPRAPDRERKSVHRDTLPEHKPKAPGPEAQQKAAEPSPLSQPETGITRDVKDSKGKLPKQTRQIRDTEKLSEIREAQVPVGSIQAEKRASDAIRSPDSNEPEAERLPMGMYRRQQSAPAVLPSEPQSTQQWQDVASIIPKQTHEATNTTTPTPLPAPGSSELQGSDIELAAASQENTRAPDHERKSVRRDTLPEHKPAPDPEAQQKAAEPSPLNQPETGITRDVKDSKGQLPKQTGKSERPTVAQLMQMFNAAPQPAAAKPVLQRSISVPAQTRTQIPANGQIATAQDRTRAGPKNGQDALLRWCQNKTKKYKNVNVRDFAKSWADGMVFCALVHSFYPDAFDFSTLKRENRKENLELAFRTAKERAGAMPLIDAEDMIAMGDRPDQRCIMTYVQTLYKCFKDVSPPRS